MLKDFMFVSPEQHVEGLGTIARDQDLAGIGCLLKCEPCRFDVGLAVLDDQDGAWVNGGHVGPVIRR